MLVRKRSADLHHTTTGTFAPARSMTKLDGGQVTRTITRTHAPARLTNRWLVTAHQQCRSANATATATAQCAVHGCHAFREAANLNYGHECIPAAQASKPSACECARVRDGGHYADATGPSTATPSDLARHRPRAQAAYCPYRMKYPHDHPQPSSRYAGAFWSGMRQPTSQVLVHSRFAALIFATHPSAPSTLHVPHPVRAQQLAPPTPAPPFRRLAIN